MAANNIQTTHSRVSYTEESFGDGCGICPSTENSASEEKDNFFEDLEEVMSSTNGFVISDGGFQCQNWKSSERSGLMP